VVRGVGLGGFRGFAVEAVFCTYGGFSTMVGEAGREDDSVFFSYWVLVSMRMVFRKVGVFRGMS